MSCVYFIPTPIGNLGDITLRALDLLAEADIVYSEDTRNTLKLLNYYQLKKNVKSYNKDNEYVLTESIVQQAENNKKIAVVSDAGTPCISDPGHNLVISLLNRKIAFEVLPGANALLPALINSGFSTDTFYFKGFLNQNKNKKSDEIKSLRNFHTTIIIYESPHRLKSTLELLVSSFKKPVAVCRELTKFYEETLFVYSLDDIKDITVKGEFVLVVDNNTPSDENSCDDTDIKIVELKRSGFSNRDIVKIMQTFGYKRNLVYKLLNE